MHFFYVSFCFSFYFVICLHFIKIWWLLYVVSLFSITGFWFDGYKIGVTDVFVSLDFFTLFICVCWNHLSVYKLQITQVSNRRVLFFWKNTDDLSLPHRIKDLWPWFKVCIVAQDPWFAQDPSPKKWWRWFHFYICICMHPWLFFLSSMHPWLSFLPIQGLYLQSHFSQLINKKSFGAMRYGILWSNIYPTSLAKKSGTTPKVNQQVIPLVTSKKKAKKEMHCIYIYSPGFSAHIFT